jgi:hypothetical protein
MTRSSYFAEAARTVVRGVLWSVVSGLLGAWCVAPALAGNDLGTIILHVQEIPSGCTLPFDCVGVGPNVSVVPGSQVFVSVYMRNYDDVSGFACRFSVDGGAGANTWGDWTILGASFSCLSGQTAQVPVQSAPPPIEPGDLTTSFLCVSGGALQPLGWMLFHVGSTGCLRIEERTLGTGLLSCSDEFTGIPVSNRGVVCVGDGGHDACEPGQVPVENGTWGKIKAQYR